MPPGRCTFRGDEPTSVPPEGESPTDGGGFRWQKGRVRQRWRRPPSSRRSPSGMSTNMVPAVGWSTFRPAERWFVRSRGRPFGPTERGSCGRKVHIPGDTKPVPEPGRVDLPSIGGGFVSRFESTPSDREVTSDRLERGRRVNGGRFVAARTLPRSRGRLVRDRAKLGVMSTGGLSVDLSFPRRSPPGEMSMARRFPRPRAGALIG